MNIWLPIITNLLLLGCFIFDFIINYKVGLKSIITRLVLTIAVGVGVYFLSPVIISGLPFLSAIGLTEISIKLFIIGFIGLILNIILSIIFYVVYRKNKYEHIDTINTAKVKRARAINSKVDRAIRKEEHRAHKLSRVPRTIKRSKTNKVFTIILSLILSLIMSAFVYTQIKAVIAYIDTNYDVEQIETGYEYTAFGQLDKLILTEEIEE